MKFRFDIKNLPHRICNLQDFLLIKSAFKVALQHLINVVILFKIVFYVKIIFTSIKKATTFTFENLEKLLRPSQHCGNNFIMFLNILIFKKALFNNSF